MYDVSGDMEGDDLLGEEIMGDAEVLGAIKRAARRRGIPAQRVRANVFKRPPLAAQPGQPDAKLRSYMGFGTLSWTGAADAADKSAIVEPQESFRGERLIIAQVVAGGTDAGLTQLRSISIGTLPQSPSVEQPAPAAMFTADATYAGLDLQVAHRGMKMQVTLARTTSPGAGVTVTASIGMYGEWIR